VATAEVAGPFKVESAPHTIAAKVIPPEEVPTVETKKLVAPGIWVAVVVIVFVVIVIAGLAARGKKQQPE
jgi:hypothetical protein